MNSWWLTGERRGPEWKHGWKGQTFSSLSLPPPPLLIIFAIVSFFLWLSWYVYVDYEEQKRHAKVGLHLLLAVIVIGLVFAAKYVWWDQYGRFIRRPSFWTNQEAVHRSEGSPWGVAAVVVLLLVLPAKEDDDEDVPIAASLSRVVKEEGSKVEGNDDDDDDDDDDHVPLAQNRANKKKPINPNKGNIMKKGEAKNNAKPSKAKNEEEDGDGDDFEVAKKKVKKRKKEEAKKVVAGKKGKKKGSVANGKKEKEKKERKVFDLPGQKHDPPEERDPLRIFYESLYQQLPNSEMATIWTVLVEGKFNKETHGDWPVNNFVFLSRMMEWGLLPVDEAKKVYANKLKNRQMKPGSPVKVVSVKKTATSSVKKVKVTNSKDSAKSLKKRKADSSDDDFNSSKKNAKKQKVSS
uniref:Uncharacterized protein n=1 Tax=Ananas comosus var. bracteatus TaxID=296719 RepID=A0A6V7QUH2_ANACO